MGSLEDDKDLDGLFAKLQGWYRTAQNHWTDWQDEAETCFAFVAGDQWSEEDKAALEAKKRPIISFNRVGIIIDSIAGSEINNRQEVRYIPRELGDAKANEILTAGGEWFRDEAHSEDEESDAFRDMLICGLGWTDTRIDYEADPAGAPFDERIDPLEMLIDPAATRANGVDSKYRFRTRRMKRCEAEALIGGEVDKADLNADWADAPERDKKPTHKNAITYDGKGEGEAKDDDEVVIVHAQWVETEEYYLVPNPETGVPEPVDDETADKLMERVPGLKLQRITDRKVMTAFLGKRILGEPVQCLANKFSFNVITGKRDRNRGYWIGIVKNLLDPQRWANKWLSQSLHILNSNAKGGLMAELSAFADQKQAEASWAKAEEITWVNNGGLAKIQPKQAAGFPAGFQELMQFAVSSIRDVSGVNLELLGQRDDAQSSGVLEYQRRQSAMTTLATLFSSLRRYRKIKGALVLDLIKDYLADGRLIRIVGQENERYIPLLVQTDAKYDVIVDESATSPNEKERSWSIITQMLPAIKDQMTPDLWMSLLEYSPLPASLVEKVKMQVQEAGKQPQTDPAAEKAKAEIALKQAQAQADLGLEQQRLEHTRQMDQAKLMAEIEAMRTKAAAELQIAREKAAFEQQRRREEMVLEAQLKREQMALMGPTAAPGDETNIPRQ